ncbi:MAG TPA: hypothetical protein VNA14_10765 [Mycobacteriales bacterium]|nr:hypothetical protein [Mycobacteriales bacterium]
MTEHTIEPEPDGAPRVPGAPADAYPPSATSFFSPALTAFVPVDAVSADDGGAITELLEMLDDGSEARPAAPPPPVVAPPMVVAPPVAVAPPVVVAPPLDVSAVVEAPRFVPAHADPPASPASAAPPPEPTPPAAVDMPAAAAAPASQEPARIPAPVAACDMCGMTVPIDAERGRCHIGHRLDPGAGDGRRGRGR